MNPEAGQRFGPYEILGRLGGGGMGLVFRAWDERLHREVAVKLLHESYTMPGMRERFLQEARAASALNHPNICTVFDIGEQNGTPYLVMELLEGETVRSRIERGALPPEEIVRYALEISEALAAASAKGIVHRDIKPANIFLVKMPSGKSQAKVLDFGLAKIGLEVGGGWESRTLDLTLSGATVGTVAYMSPEQARGESLDMRSDLFSLGVVLYEMATRRVPFEGTTSAMMFVQLFSQAPEPVRTWNEAIPRELERIILKLMAKDRSDRFQTTKELQDALMKVGGKLGRGGWLQKGSLSAVPLVRAYDPVAPHKGPRRRPGQEQGDTPGSRLAWLEAKESSNGDRVAHPVEGTHPVQARFREMESTYAQPQRSKVYGVVEQGDSSAEEIAAGFDPGALAADPELHRESVLDSSRLGRARFEDSSRDLAAQWPESYDDSLEELVADQTKRIRIRMAFAVIVIVGVAVGASLLIGRGIFRPMVLTTRDRLLLTLIQNKTGDKTLDGTVMQGLEIALHQSRTLNVLGGEAYRAGLRQLNSSDNDSVETVPVQSIAQKVGARVYLFGEITGSEAPYTISVDVLQTDSNDKVASFDEVATSREEIPAAIGRLALAVRREVSEDTKAELRRSVSFEGEASGNVDALHAYVEGSVAEQKGSIADALRAYREAVRFDPKFAQAQMRLAWLDREEMAEIASAQAAGLARDAASHASDSVKLLAQFCFEMNASGDLEKATKTIREYAAQYPLNVEGRRGLALALRLQGRSQEALAAAQQGYEEHPFDAGSYVEAKRDLVEMDRYGSALELTTRSMQTGSSANDDTLMTAYLNGQEDVVSVQRERLQGMLAGAATDESTGTTYSEWNSYGLYLDNTGRKKAAVEAWRAAAADAEGDSELSGTQGSLLAQAALDQALAESCSVSLAMVEDGKNLSKGPVASFDAGMAAALCGDQPYAVKIAAALEQQFPRNTMVTRYYVPELEAAAEIGINEPEKALPGLTAFGQNDPTLLSAYLRGMAHAALGQTMPASHDFQAVLARRGEATMRQGDLYPMAEISLARVFMASHDRPDSVESYRRFSMLWSDADQRQPLVVEALARSK
ncbi:protein kinase [Granulicella sp. S190]|uniref:serine/threonine-protein kinase n=1 Tax=Granulicella sp. S190 TaxID=1747226 RepID=UPI00131CA79A|nr:serine/threonine-protein kinase [Granulicella sp. S190]